MTVHVQAGVFPFIEGQEYEVDPETGCWNWSLWRNKRGYGRTQRRELQKLTGTQYAHRAGFMALRGYYPPNIHIHHRCENPSCVNPDHLEPIEHGLHLQGHWRDGSKLTEEDIKDIRWSMWDGEMGMTQLARKYELSVEYVRDILDGRAWRTATGPIGKPPCRKCRRLGASRRTMLCAVCRRLRGRK